MDNITVLVAVNALTVAGVLAKVIFEFLTRDDSSNRAGVQKLTAALHDAKLEIARLQERLDALNKHMATFSNMWTQMHLMQSRITRLEMASMGSRKDCLRDEEMFRGDEA